MLRPRINKKSQVILEVVIVFVCLAIIGIAATRLFADLNLNMLGRLQVYRGSRPFAVNAPATLGASSSTPTFFLDYFPKTMPGRIPPPIIPPTFPTDSRLDTADKASQDAEDCVTNMRGKINHANLLAQALDLDVEVDAAGIATAQWNYPEYIEEIRGDCRAAEGFADGALSNYSLAAATYRNIVKDPNGGGVHEAWSKEDLDSLKELADELENEIIPQLEAFVKLLKEGNPAMGFYGLDYIIEAENLGKYTRLGTYTCDPPTATSLGSCSPTPEHKHCVDSLEEMAKIVGSGLEPIGPELPTVTTYCTREDPNCCSAQAVAKGQCVPYTGD